MGTVISIHNESEYNEMLRQAVAVIENARNNATRAIVSTSNEISLRSKTPTQRWSFTMATHNELHQIV